VWTLDRLAAKKTWSQVVEEDCQTQQLIMEDAIDSSKWRGLIKDIE